MKKGHLNKVTLGYQKEKGNNQYIFFGHIGKLLYLFFIKQCVIPNKETLKQRIVYINIFVCMYVLLIRFKLLIV